VPDTPFHEANLSLFRFSRINFFLALPNRFWSAFYNDYQLPTRFGLTNRGPNSRREARVLSLAPE
jgi:hypothetical protein